MLICCLLSCEYRLHCMYVYCISYALYMYSVSHTSIHYTFPLILKHSNNQRHGTAPSPVKHEKVDSAAAFNPQSQQILRGFFFLYEVLENREIRCLPGLFDDYAHKLVHVSIKDGFRSSEKVQQQLFVTSHFCNHFVQIHRTKTYFLFNKTRKTFRNCYI